MLHGVTEGSGDRYLSYELIKTNTMIKYEHKCGLIRSSQGCEQKTDVAVICKYMIYMHFFCWFFFFFIKPAIRIWIRLLPSSFLLAAKKTKTTKKTTSRVEDNDSKSSHRRLVTFWKRTDLPTQAWASIWLTTSAAESRWATVVQFFPPGSLLNHHLQHERGNEIHNSKVDRRQCVLLFYDAVTQWKVENIWIISWSLFFKFN